MDAVILLIGLLANTVLGILVFLRNSRSATNKLFFLLTLDICAWSIANYISLHTGINSLLFWMRFVMMLAVPQAVLFFLLIHTLPSTKVQLQPKYLYPLLVLAIITMVVAMSNYLFTGLTMTGNIPSPVPGPGMILFLLVTLGSLVAGTVTLINKFIKATGVQKTQYKFLFLGLVSMFLLIVTLNFATVVVFNNLQFIAFSPLFTLPFIGMLAYIIVRHRFLDISYLVTRAFIYILLITIIAGLFSTLVFLISQLLFDLTFTLEQQSVLILITLVITLSFQTIQRFIMRFTDKMFYRLSYNTDDLLIKLNKIMTTTLELEKLGKELLNVLISDVKIMHAAIVVGTDQKQKIIQTGESSVDIDTDFLQLFKGIKKNIIFEELEEGTLKESLRKKNIILVLPLFTESKSVGLLLVGQKKSGDVYVERDLQFFNLLAPELSIALQNALAYEEIKQFNTTLQQEVDKATKDLKDANEQLQDLDDLKDEFVSLASHELRTPMAAIKGSVSTILEGYAGEISDQAREFLTAAYNENDRLIRLVNNLLNTSRIESGRLSYTITDINIGILISEVVKNLQIAVKEKGIHLTYEAIGSLPHVRGDEDKVKEVLINLIANAIKFTTKGGITVSTEVKDGMVIISVRDTGTGIHREDFDLLFKKFSQVKRDQKYTKVYGGTGLGLYLSQKIIEGLGGKIWLESEVGKGTTFFFTLPVAS